MSDYEFYKALSSDEIDKIIKELFQNLEDRDKVEDTLLNLALFTDGHCFKKLYTKLIDNGIFYPPEIFKYAGSEIADKLIKLVETGEYFTNHLLIGLAWIGTQNVIDFFLRSSVEKPSWTNGLYVLPKEYADQAGWIIADDGSKRTLISNEVKVFAKSAKTQKSSSKISTFKALDGKCPFCENPLTKVFNTSINHKDIEFSTCLLCGCYEPVFMNINDLGKSSWHNKNKCWEHFDNSMEIDPIEENILTISDEIRTPYCTISQFGDISKSQIGGYPTWVQDAEYLRCPECNKKMNYIGQVDMEDVEEYSEGIYYFHYCPECNITGSNYQQS
jgi:uncharacterized protein with PIN domain